jgi:hypothetical protein
MWPEQIGGMAIRAEVWRPEAREFSYFTGPNPCTLADFRIQRCAAERESGAVSDHDRTSLIHGVG